MLAVVVAAPVAVGADSLAPTFSTIPFVLDQSRIVVDVELRPGTVLPFVFDSGLSEGNIVTRAVADSLQIKGAEKARIGDASGDRQVAKVATLSSIRVGNVRFSNQIFAVVDVPNEVTRRDSGKAVAGFLGAPLMKAAVLCIDYQKGTLQRWARTSFKSEGRSSVPLKLVHGLPTIAVIIDGRPARMIVDSGNNAAIVVYEAFAERYDFHTRYPDLAPHGGRDGGGQHYEALITDARSVEIGIGAGFENVPLAVIPQGMPPSWGIDGMIGYELLAAINPCIDRDGGRLFYYGE